MSDTDLSVEDERATRLLIELTYRYGRAMDDRDWEAFRSVFTDDVHVNLGDTYILTGRQEITDAVRPLIEACSITHHMMTNHLVELDGDRATMGLYCRAFHKGSGTKANQTYECLARYTAAAVRTNGEWAISEWNETVYYDWGSQDVLIPDPLP